MANFLLALKTALAVIPEVIAIIKAIESPGGGPQKLSAVVQIVMEALGALPDELKGLINASTFGKYVEKVVGIVVTLFNSLGIFSKKA